MKTKIQKSTFIKIDVFFYISDTLPDFTERTPRDDRENSNRIPYD